MRPHVDETADGFFSSDHADSYQPHSVSTGYTPPYFEEHPLHSQLYRPHNDFTNSYMSGLSGRYREDERVIDDSFSSGVPLASMSGKNSLLNPPIDEFAERRVLSETSGDSSYFPRRLSNYNDYTGNITGYKAGHGKPGNGSYNMVDTTARQYYSGFFPQTVSSPANSKVSGALRQLATQLDADLSNYTAQIESAKEQAEMKFQDVAIENAQLREQLKANTAKIDDLLKKSLEYSEQLRAKTAEFSEWRKQINDKQAAALAAVETRLADENKDLRTRNRKLQEELEIKNSKFNKIEAIICSYRSQFDNNTSSNDDAVKAGGAETAHCIGFELFQRLDESLGSDATSSVTAEASLDDTLNDAFAEKGSQYSRPAQYVEVVCEHLSSFCSFSNESKAKGYTKNGSGYNFGDSASPAEELRKLLKEEPNIANNSKVIQCLEEVIVNRYLASEKAVTLSDSCNAEQNDNKRTDAAIETPYVLSLMAHMTAANIFSIVCTSIRYNSWQWLNICKDAWFLKMLDLKFEGMPSDCHPAIIAMKTMDEYNCLEFMKYMNLIGTINSEIRDNDTLDTLWHFAVYRKESRLLDFFLTQEKFTRCLESKNLAGKTSLDLVDDSFRGKLFTAIVLSYSYEASTYYKSSMYQEALDTYEKAIEYQTLASSNYSGKIPAHFNDNMAKLQYNKARSLMHVNRWMEAIACCEECISTTPRYSNSYATAIQAYELLYDWPSALAMCQRLNEVVSSTANDQKMKYLRDQQNATMFQVLGIPRASELAEVKQAFNRLCVIWHPDKAANKESADIRKRHENHFKRILKAKDYLLSAENRRLESMKRETPYISPTHTTAKASSPAPKTWSPSPLASPKISKPASPVSPPTDEATRAALGKSAPKKNTKVTSVAASPQLGSAVPVAKADSRKAASPAMKSPSSVTPPSNSPKSSSTVRGAEAVSPDYSKMSKERLDALKLSTIKSVDSLMSQKAEKLSELAELEKKTASSQVFSNSYISQISVVTREIRLIHSKIDEKNASLEDIRNALLAAEPVKKATASSFAKSGKQAFSQTANIRVESAGRRMESSETQSEDDSVTSGKLQSKKQEETIFIDCSPMPSSGKKESKETPKEREDSSANGAFVSPSADKSVGQSEKVEVKASSDAHTGTGSGASGSPFDASLLIHLDSEKAQLQKGRAPSSSQEKPPRPVVSKKKNVTTVSHSSKINPAENSPLPPQIPGNKEKPANSDIPAPFEQNSVDHIVGDSDTFGIFQDIQIETLTRPAKEEISEPTKMDSFESMHVSCGSTVDGEAKYIQGREAEETTTTTVNTMGNEKAHIDSIGSASLSALFPPAGFMQDATASFPLFEYQPARHSKNPYEPSVSKVVGEECLEAGEENPGESESSETSNSVKSRCDVSDGGKYSDDLDDIVFAASVESSELQGLLHAPPPLSSLAATSNPPDYIYYVNNTDTPSRQPLLPDGSLNDKEKFLYPQQSPERCMSDDSSECYNSEDRSDSLEDASDSLSSPGINELYAKRVSRKDLPSKDLDEDSSSSSYSAIVEDSEYCSSESESVKYQAF